MKLNLVICLRLPLYSWWQKTLEKTYGLRCPKGVILVTPLPLGKVRAVDEMLS